MNFVKSSAIKLSKSSQELWANDVISAVRFNPNHTYIEQVLAHPDHGDVVGAPSEYTRQNLASSIKAGVQFVTATCSKDGLLRKGAPVHLVTINGKEYLRTISNRHEEADDLGDIPQF